MATYDSTTAQCLVYSFKDGLLSKIAHDLKHRVTRFKLAVDEQARSIHAEIDASSLCVDCVMQDGVESGADLSDSDKSRIEQQIAEDVLHAKDHPTIRFRSTSVTPSVEGLYIQGTLALNDHTRPVSTVARRVNNHYEAEMVINQPEFGIKPFSAMLGTLKIKPEVVVRFTVPAV
jgi:hypothetical protein